MVLNVPAVALNALPVDGFFMKLPSRYRQRLHLSKGWPEKWFSGSLLQTLSPAGVPLTGSFTVKVRSTLSGHPGVGVS